MSPSALLRRRAVGLAAALLLGTGLAGAPLLPGQAYADPPPWAGGHWKHHKHKHHDHDDVRVVYVPVERQVHHYHAPVRQVPVARGLPYGFNRGTCDRDLISSEVLGNVMGGVAGGLLGNQIGAGSGRTAATIGGTMIGVMVGGSVGRSMDSVDHGCVSEALDYLPDNRRIAWRGDEGENYRMMPVRSYQVAGGGYCREYQATAVIGGRRQTTYGTACRQPDGQWAIVD